VTKILAPQQPAPIMEIARALLPPGMELIVVDPATPGFYVTSSAWKQAGRRSGCFRTCAA
jgi:hypothetical protein